MVVAVPARDEAGSITDRTLDVARSTSTEFCELAVIEEPNIGM